MNEKIKILIVDDSNETRKLIQKFLEFDSRFIIVGQADTGERGIELALKHKPDVILMDINMPGITGLEATERLNLIYPEVVIIIMSVQTEKEYLKQAITAGAKDYIIKPFDIKDLETVIINTYEKEQKKKENLKQKLKEKEPKKSKVISVFSTKGGVGKTTLAVNIAISLARQTTEKVAVVDLDLLFGDVCILLNILPNKTIADMIEDFSTISKDTIQEYMHEYSYGVSILAAPKRPEYAEYISPNHIEKIIDILKETYTYVIIDTGINFSEPTLVALDKSDTIFFVSTMDVASIKNMKLGLEVMNSLNYTKEKVKIILNKATQKFGVKYKDVVNILEQLELYYIKEDNSTVLNSINTGYPFMKNRFSNPLIQNIKKLAQSII